METAGIVARHLIPLIGTLGFGWSAGQFLLLSVFNLAFSVACIGVIGVAVSMRKTYVSIGLADEISSWLTLVAIGIFLSLLLTALFGWVVALMLARDEGQLFSASLGWSAALMLVTTMPTLLLQYRADLRSPLSEEQRKQRDQPNVLSLLIGAGLIFVLSGQAANLGYAGVISMVVAVTALFLLRDLRPDLVRELARTSRPSR